MKCRDLMQMEMQWIPGDATAAEAARVMRDRSVGFLLVSDTAAADRLAGVITDRDITIRVCAEGLSLTETKVSTVASRDIVTCGEDEDLTSAEERMGEAQKSRLPVVDETGQVVGVLSLTAILRTDSKGRAVKTANAILARDAGAPQAPIDGIHLTPSTPADEDAVANREHVIVMGAHRGSMKEFPT